MSQKLRSEMYSCHVYKNLPRVLSLFSLLYKELILSLLEWGMATHSSILAWRIPRTEEPGGQQSIGSQRVRHGWNDLACTHELSWIRRKRNEIWKVIKDGQNPKNCCLLHSLTLAHFSLLLASIFSLFLFSLSSFLCLLSSYSTIVWTSA